ncbi:MlaD family protein [Nocardia africana]|uniref:Virulence factor Mce family protein n=1 Tax=Nocardia africana TaxID=134964 RepID=A0A378WYI7_9NOCA|nr:MCE family protein [Nocardia africana]MCC3312294.1 MCE family protein [Nocardia africana]SUA46396.1 virulence factor Mce family protein [Nocardia africana]
MKAPARAALWRLGIAAVLGTVLLIAISNAVTRPVAGHTRGFTADFTDVAGLHVGADVRVRGVQVGKVTAIDLRRLDDRSVGTVAFTMTDRYGVDAGTRLAIKFQALTGLRYLDVAAATENSGAGTLTHVPTTMTQPSFDVTTLFNGLQPVFATLTPDEVNTFTANAANLLQGDGGGLGPMLDSIAQLTRFVSDRQQVIATVMQNLKTVADTLGGQSPQIVQILDWLNRPLDSALKVLDEFRKSDVYGPTFASSVLRILDNLGISRGLNLDQLLQQAFGSATAAAQALRNLPGVLDGLSTPPPPGDGAALTCSHGQAALPLPVQVLLNGRKVMLCNPA